MFSYGFFYIVPLTCTNNIHLVSSLCQEVDELHSLHLLWHMSHCSHGF